MWGHLEVVRTLLEAGAADVNDKSKVRNQMMMMIIILLTILMIMMIVIDVFMLIIYNYDDSK